jgi:hypothetical protein
LISRTNGVAIAWMIDYNSGKNITSLFNVGGKRQKKIPLQVNRENVFWKIKIY